MEKKKYIAVIVAGAVRDVQVDQRSEHDPLSDTWYDCPDAEIYLGIFEADDEKTARYDAAAFGRTAESNIKLIEI